MRMVKIVALGLIVTCVAIKSSKKTTTSKSVSQLMLKQGPEVADFEVGQISLLKGNCQMADFEDDFVNGHGNVEYQQESTLNNSEL